jgi:type VII secretion-associated serine protease mycosin
VTRRRLGALAAALFLVPTAYVGGGSAPASAAVECTPDETHYISEQSYPLARLGISSAWKHATGKGVRVAVVDSGVAAGNAHLRDAVVPGRSFVPGDSDPSGRTDVWRHGTAVAGIIGARLHEGSAVIGVAPDSTILPVRVYAQEGGEGYQPPASQLPDLGRLAEGIRWAADNGADVINVSMSSLRSSPALESAVASAVRRDVVVVAAGGNREPEDAPDGNRYPAALPGVIAVSGSDTRDRVTDYSIHGPHIDVAAPGTQVLTTFLANGDCLVGTDNAYSSYATAFVSGIAALLRERHPDASAEEIGYRIMAGADRRSRGERDDVAGWGLVQPLEALTMTIDASRPGPAVVGASGEAAPATSVKKTPPLHPFVNPLEERRAALLWWVLLGGGFVALALLLRPLVAAYGRSRAR